MLWGCFSWNGVDSLVQIEETMNADKYIEIINENLEEVVLKLVLKKNLFCSRITIRNTLLKRPINFLRIHISNCWNDRHKVRT